MIGTPYSLLSVTLSPSQSLYTRRGTLLALTGDPTNVTSHLRTLNPIRRALIGIPFLYQATTSTTPVSLLITPKSTNSTISVLQLDGTQDWKIAQRAALLAWTGSSLNITPSISQKLSLAHWGSSNITGRGLLALAAQGNTFSVELGAGESFVAHPSNILAYSLNQNLPQPYRFRSRQARFQIPLGLGNWFPENRFVRAWKTGEVYKFFQGLSLRVKRWSRRTIWGDRLFLRFEGPGTVLVQSRGWRVGEILNREQVEEIAETPVGVEQIVRQERIRQDGTFSSKRDQDRMGVEGASVSAQTSRVAEAVAPVIASPGAKELNRMGRDEGLADDKKAQQEKLAKEAATKNMHHA